MENILKALDEALSLKDYQIKCLEEKNRELRAENKKLSEKLENEEAEK